MVADYLALRGVCAAPTLTLPHGGGDIVAAGLAFVHYIEK